METYGEAFRQIVRERIEEHRGTADPFQQGYLLGLHRAVTLMRQTAALYDIPADAIGVADIDESEFV